MQLDQLKTVLLNTLILVSCALFISQHSNAQQQWVQVISPDISDTRNLLNGISGTSSSDVWVVGEYESISPAILRNLIMHWNGSDWQIFSGTDPGYIYNDLWDVTAITSNNVWAVGAWNEPGTTRSQLLHWNGISWTHTVLPNIQGGSFLFGIDAIASNDIWAVGGRAGSPTDPVYVIHYDGSDWTEIPAQNPGTYRNWFDDVDGITSNDVWAVGRKSNSYGDFHAMVQHWDGDEWTNSPLPASVTNPLGELESVTMISANDVWALGSTVTGGILMIHWDGTSWSQVPTAGSAGGIIAARETEVFGLGDRISQWDGSVWTVIDSLNHLSYPSLVSAVTFPNGDIWSAGRTWNSSFHTLVYRTVSAPLAILTKSYSIHKIGSTAILEWTTLSESNVNKFVMERSSGDIEFTPVNSTVAQGSGYNYQLIDSFPLFGWNYYRLKVVDIDGSSTTLPVTKLKFNNKGLGLFGVYPNPIVGSVVNFWINLEGEHFLFLCDEQGKEIMNITLSGIGSTGHFDLPANLTPGVYVLSLVKENMVWSEKIVIK